MKKLLIYHARAAELHRLISERVNDVEIAAGFDAATLDRHMADADALLAWKFPLAALEGARTLRWIQLSSAGAEQLLPARDRLGRIVVTNTRGIHVDLMAVPLDDDRDEFKVWPKPPDRLIPAPL